MTSTVLFDARWIGQGGVGRVTAQMLDGVRRQRPTGPWSVWLDRPDTPLWDGAQPVLARSSAGAWAGQRCLLEVPPADVAVFPANLRPLRPVGRASLTVLYDTIPLAHEPSALRRRALLGLFWSAARLSTRVLTISQHSARCLVRDLGISPRRVTVLPIPYDRELVGRIRTARAAGPPSEPLVLFIGRFAPHKNLDRLLDAFARTRVAADGGRLVLAGDGGPVAARLAARAAELGVRVELPGRLTEEQLVAAYARAWVVVLPSLDEGLGLPAIEALAAGIPLVGADRGGIREAVGDRCRLVDPLDVHDIARGLDEAVASGGVGCGALVRWAEGWPDVDDLGSAVLDEVEAVRRRLR